MYAERKLQLIDQILKTDDEVVLIKLQTVIEAGKTSFKDFAGIWTEADANEISRSLRMHVEP